MTLICGPSRPTAGGRTGHAYERASSISLGVSSLQESQMFFSTQHVSMNMSCGLCMLGFLNNHRPSHTHLKQKHSGVPLDKKYICVYICRCIYIERERKRHRESDREICCTMLSHFVSYCMIIYLFSHIMLYHMGKFERSK